MQRRVVHLNEDVDQDELEPQDNKEHQRRKERESHCQSPHNHTGVHTLGPRLHFKATVHPPNSSIAPGSLRIDTFDQNLVARQEKMKKFRNFVDIKTELVKSRKFKRCNVNTIVVLRLQK